MNEHWRPVVGHEDRYEVSDLGNVRSQGWTAADASGRIRIYPTRLLRATPNSSGYPSVDLKSKTGRVVRLVHHLVLEAFDGPRPKGFEACHWDGDRKNARLSNLRWDTQEANRQDAVRHGTHISLRTHCPYGHLLMDPNLVPSNRDGRACLACSRARACAQRRGERATQALRDSYYAALAA